ncbi:zinc finger protein chinmo isoform X2 [Agrilus planipennis]|uniref:Zinc finger protein chinmo isoform X2 n=1 Tax=Agrilus planipennis TaxID=224129 RepID=A0A7F5RL47_AGRPL|nr:zinc finger protein chinmo isoform X2 [Agrilus planipennis]
MEMPAKNIFQSSVEMDTQQQQFCLKWNSFGTNLATSFSNLFKSESLADVTLFCEGVTFKAHKLILAACSKHLADLFETAPLHQNLLVILDGTSATNMSALLEFMYKGEVHISQDALSSFLKAAECLQVKGLSIEHEKLAVAQSQPNIDSSLESPTSRKPFRVLKDDSDQTSNMQQQQQHQPGSSPSYSPSMSPFMHPSQYRQQFDQRLPPTNTSFETAQQQKRSLRSPNDMLQERASVLRDGKAATRPNSPPPVSLGYRLSSSGSCPLPSPHDEGGNSEAHYHPDPSATSLVCPENASEHCQDPGCPEDLRMKIDPVQEEHLSTSGNGNIGEGGSGSSGTAAPNGSVGPVTSYDIKRKDTDLMSATLWNSVGKIGKSGSVTTPDGKKLKCPFCERLYGYETNLRAHIRQRHQGIRVPCPFCSRTFTRNNTVRRHIAREHKTELSLKAFQQTQQAHNHN